MGSSRLVWAPVVTSKPAAGIHNETPLTSPPSFCVCLIDCFGRVLRLRSLRGKECVGRLSLGFLGAHESGGQRVLVFCLRDRSVARPHALSPQWVISFSHFLTEGPRTGNQPALLSRRGRSVAARAFLLSRSLLRSQWGRRRPGMQVPRALP